MNTTIMKKRGKYIAICIAIVLCTVAVIFLGCFKEQSLNDNVSTESVASISTPYGKLRHGSTYVHTTTDVAKITAMHNGSATSDTEAVTVDSSKSHGSEENPFVIDSETLWNAFAADLNTTSSDITNYGAGYYFILAKDLNFSGKTFTQVSRFDGTFYGLGHSISNVTYSCGNNKGSGIFRSSYNSIVADINIKNASFSDCYIQNGLLIGYAEGGKYLNCHTNGTMTRTTRLTIQSNVGGVIGTIYNKDTLVYRCSTEYTSSFLVNSINGGLLGVIVGGTGGTGKLSVWDCYGNGTNSYDSRDTSGTLKADAYVGVIALADKSGAVELENIVSNFAQIDLQYVTAAHVASVFGTWSGQCSPSKMTFKNIYASGKGRRNSTEFTVNPSAYITTQASTFNSTVVTSQNVNCYTGTSPKFDSANFSDLFTTNATARAGLNKSYASETALWNAASNTSNALPNAIWNKSLIGQTYTVDNSPVLNDLKTDNFTIKYVDYSPSGDKNLGITDTTYDYGDSVTLPTPSGTTNKVFKGWTTDNTGDNVITDTSVSDFYGDVTLYATWDNPNATASITVYNSDTKDTTPTVEYGVGTVKLTAVVATPDMSSPSIECNWYKDTDTTAKKLNSKDITIQNVKESGTYKLEYSVIDGTLPLWQHTVKLSSTAVTQAVTVTQGQYTLDSFVLDSSTIPYYGRELNDIKFTVTVKNSAGIGVNGTAEWQNKYATVANGANTPNITFTPTDKDNYGTGSTLAVPSFNSQYFQLTFNMDIGYDLKVNMQYGKTYHNYEIKKLFLDAFRAVLDDNTDPRYADFNSVASRTPSFAGVDFNSYSGSITATNVQPTVAVAFPNNTDYTITYDLQGGTASVTSATKKFNDLLTDAPTPTKTGYIFLGWEYTDIDLSTGTSSTRDWNIATDRVIHSVTLSAKWLAANLTLTGISVTEKNPSGLDALTVLDGSEIEVVAHFDTDSAVQPTMDITLSMGGANGYTLTYENGSELHVDYPNITVSYSYNGGSPVTQTKALTVNPIKVDMSGATFADKTVTYDGTVKSITPINTAQLPLQVSTAITYEYRLGTTLVPPSNVIQEGVYRVKAIFTTNDTDYAVDPLEATLTVGRPATPVNIEWDSFTFGFNTMPQHPQVAAIKDAGGNVITVPFHYEGDDSVSAVGSGYNIRVVLDNSSYTVTDGSDRVSFSITRAALTAPKVRDDVTIVYDGTPKNLADFLDMNYDANLMEITLNASATDAKKYKATIGLKSQYNNDIYWSSGKTVEEVEWTIEKAHLTADWDNNDEHVFDNQVFQPAIVGLLGLASVDANAVDYVNDIIYDDTSDLGKSQVGAYVIRAELNANAPWTVNYILDGNSEWAYVIMPKSGMQVITIEWDETPLEFNGKVQMPSYKVYDKDGNDITDQVKGMLTFGGDYDKSKWADDYSLTVNQPGNTYFIKSGLKCDYTITLDANGNGYNPNPDDEGGSSLDSVGKILKEWWQVIASGVSIILIVAFLAKTASYESRSKKADKKADKYESSVYAAATGAFGLAVTAWNVIAGVLMGLAVVSLVIMIIAKSRCSKAEDGLEEAREQYEHNRENSRRDYDDSRREEEDRRRDEEYRRMNEDMKAMLMRMMGGGYDGMNMGQGMPQGMYMGAQQGIGADEIRGIISETVTALLPGMQQALPAQASANDELVNRLIEQNEKLMQKLEEKSAEKQVAATNSNDEIVQKLIEQNDKLMQKLADKSAEPNKNDETIKQLMEQNAQNQRAMQEMIQKLANQPQIVQAQPIVQPQPQIIERVVEKPVEKIVEKVVEKPVEKVVEKPVAVNVTSAVAEKSKQVKAAPKKDTAPRLTLEEAYAKLTKEQKKYFDGLREYAMKKDSKCKEKLATYFTTIGPSTTNPLIKLTIKKGVTVALFKMEDEYLKDIRRNASSDGTKLKVKETELPVGDSQAFDTAKDMIDLRIDQIERYEDFMKEQRAMKRK